MRSVAAVLAPVALAAACAAASAAPKPAASAAPPAPLRADHPLVGAWRFEVPGTTCAETYRIDRGGTTLVTSAEEVAETKFTLTDQPSAKGFYKWVDTLVRDNGKKDCSGQVTKPPRVSTNYIKLNPAGTIFIMCIEEDERKCIGPFVRLEGGEI